MHQSNHLPILYAQNCPEQPIIPTYQTPKQKYDNHINDSETQDQLGNVTRVITHRKYLKQFRPRIIRGNRVPYHHSYQLKEHEREVNSMKKRIQNVKSIQQRKKDKNDPIIYPPYFIRGNGQNSDVKIDAYTKKALNSAVWKIKQKQINKIYEQNKSRIQVPLTRKKSLQKYHYNVDHQENQTNPEQQQQYNNHENSEQESSMPTPAFYKKQRVVLKPVQSSPINIKMKDVRDVRDVSNLPGNDIRSVLDFIYNHLLYKQKDLQALKSRMMHAYGKQEVQNTWKISMRLLQREI